jgi:hypothetical protein
MGTLDHLLAQIAKLTHKRSIQSQRQTIHSDKKKDINSRTDHSFIQMMKTKSQMNHST